MLSNIDHLASYITMSEFQRVFIFIEKEANIDRSFHYNFKYEEIDDDHGRILIPIYVNNNIVGNFFLNKTYLIMSIGVSSMGFNRNEKYDYFNDWKIE